MNSIKVCEYSRSRSFHDDLILQDQASGERSQDHWSSGLNIVPERKSSFFSGKRYPFIMLKLKNGLNVLHVYGFILAKL